MKKGPLQIAIATNMTLDRRSFLTLISSLYPRCHPERSEGSAFALAVVSQNGFGKRLLAGAASVSFSPHLYYHLGP
jgi:hypothetical protein